MSCAVTTATSNFLGQSSNKTMNTENKDGEKGEDNALNDGDDDFKCEQVSLEDVWSLSEEEEDLWATVNAIRDRAEHSSGALEKPSVANQQPSVVDFLRNFLSQAGMTETLDCFQTEWNEMVQKGLVDEEQVGAVPVVYTENQSLERELKNARRERAELTRTASVAAETLARVQRARNVHRRQHQRLVQEKNRLIEDIKKMKLRCESYEPAVKRMNEKYQAALRQVSLMALERDRVSLQSKSPSDHRDVLLCGGEEDKTGEPRDRQSGDRVSAETTSRSRSRKSYSL